MRQTLEQEIATLENKLRKAQAELKTAEKPPPAVIQSLPEDNDLANSTLFFLYKPDLLRLLSHMTIKAQQILLPWPWCCDSRWDVRKSIEVQNFRTCWADHFNMQKEYYNPPGKPGTVNVLVKLLSRGQAPSSGSQDVAGSHIDSLTNRRHGVWWPDDLHREFACKSDGRLIDRGGFFNPFQQLPDSILTEHWTERMPRNCMDLQWTMKLGDEILNIRGNQPLASQCNKPKWLRKHEYLALCGLRAFPHQQLRKLLIALQESSLPLIHAPVHHLLRQLLYHVGPVDDDGGLHWKKDIPDLMEKFQEVLRALADEFSAKPRAHQAMPALADLFNYFIQWASCDPLASLSLVSGCRQLSETALSWAKDTVSQMLGLATDRQR